MKDLVIIGGGPAGLAAGIYAMRSGLDAVLMERGAPGGAVLNTEKIENYPGFPGGIDGPQLMSRMEKHARDLGLPMETNEVHEITRDGGIFRLRTRTGEVETRTIILATGTGPRPLGVEGETRLRGRGVSYCAICDGAFFRDQVVAVVGGGDAAVEEAQFLTKFAAKVYLIHRRDSLRAAKGIQKGALENEKIEPLWSSVVTEIRGGNSVEEVVVKNLKTEEKTTLKVDGIFVYVGVKPNSYIVEGLVELDERGFIVTDNQMRTSVPGIFAAGDVRTTPLRQVVTAVADGAVAAIYAERYLAYGNRS
ncbi:MAG: thioredoxin-disulfide reductase [Thermoanaerobacterales bacterium]|nr:thioredoxin-disulfide reductase [Thermoanaerobacterales bacterium]